MTPQEQAHVFLAMMGCGAGLGVVYELLAPLRKRGGHCALADLLFGVFAAAGVILTALALRVEAFRLYVLIAFGLGLALYRLTIGQLIRGIVRLLAGKIQKL